jgi:hypothetical protein
MKLPLRFAIVCLAFVALWEPAACAASIEFGPVTVTNGANLAVSILADVGDAPLGRYDAVISYDADRVRVVSLTRGDEHFAAPTVNAGIPGQIRLCANNGASLSLPTGTVQVAVLVLEPIGATGANTRLRFETAALLRAADVTSLSTTTKDATIALPGGAASSSSAGESVAIKPSGAKSRNPANPNEPL